MAEYRTLHDGDERDHIGHPHYGDKCMTPENGFGYGPPDLGEECFDTECERPHRGTLGCGGNPSRYFHIRPDLGRNGLHDVAPHVDLSDPANAALRAHFTKRRRLTLDAIIRGLELSNIEPVNGQAISVLYELEKMWRDDEAFS